MISGVSWGYEKSLELAVTQKMKNPSARRWKLRGYNVIMKLHNLLFSGSGANSLVGEFGVFIIRFAFGLTLMLAHGLGKIPPSGQFIEGVGKLGFPSPEIFAWFSALAEFLGGGLLAVGLLTRFASLAIAINMAVAFCMAHYADPFQKKEMAFLYGVVALGFLLFGGGKLSLDGVISTR